MKLHLTDRFCAHAKAASGSVQTDYYDEAITGLVLRVSAAGKKTWTYIFTSPVDGKRVRLSIGTYPATSLGAARERATDARKLVEEGRDPRREAQSHAGVLTVADLVENYLGRAVSTKRSFDEIARRLRKNVSGRDAEGNAISGASRGCIGDVKLTELHRRDITRCIDAVVDRGAKVEANRVFEDVRAMIRWARGRGDLDLNLAEGMKRPTETRERDRVLSADEIRTMWTELDRADMWETTRRIIRLCLITGQRVGEIAGMRESEISRDVWAIPPERSKNGREHTVPLSDLALAIMEQQRADVRRLADRKRRAVSDFLFPGPGGEAPVTAAAVAKAIKRQEISNRGNTTILGIDNWTAHDLRRTAATHMEEIGISPFIIAHLLNHISITKSSITSRVYARYDYGKEKREAINMWNERLKTMISNSNSEVVPLSDRKTAK
jgi:integrase